MPRSKNPAANASTDAAALLRRLGFALLFFAIPAAALFARRAVVIVAPLAVVLLILAAFLDGGSRSPAEKMLAVIVSPGGAAGSILLFWAVLSLIWTPFAEEASERLFNIIGMCVMGIIGYLAIPDRMRSANLYILPVGVGMAALMGMIAVFREVASQGLDDHSLDRGIILLVLLLWPAITWLHSRGRNLEAVLLAVIVALASLFTSDLLALQALVAGAIVFMVVALMPATGARLVALVMAGLLLFAPLLPFILEPVARALGLSPNLIASLDVWQNVILDAPHRLITGHGLESALRGRFFGLLPLNAPSSILFEIWYDLGVVGAVAASALLYRVVTIAGGERPVLGPGIMAAFASAYTLGCLGVGTAQIWWFTALVVIVLVFVAIERGQFRTTRPKAILRPVH